MELYSVIIYPQNLSVVQHRGRATSAAHQWERSRSLMDSHPYQRCFVEFRKMTSTAVEHLTAPDLDRALYHIFESAESAIGALALLLS